MRQDLYTTLGFFSPSFFRMHIDVNEDLADLNNIAQDAAATFLHEYIHYIQDISTTYGLLNIINVVNYIKAANQLLIEGNISKLEIPFKPSDNNQTIQDNRDVSKIYLGSGKGVSNCTEFKVNLQTDLIYADKKNNPVKRVIIECKDAGGQSIKYGFGGYCISESMAYGIEKHAYPDILSMPPQLPYTSASIVVSVIYPDFGNDEMNVIALCDASLMLFDPGLCFYDMLIHMRDVQWLPDSPSDVYHYVEQNIVFKFEGKTTVRELFQYIKPLAIQSLCDYFTTQEVFKENQVWIRNTIENAGNLRLTIPGFLIDVGLLGDIRSNICFGALHESLGTPFYTNQEQIGWFHSNLIQQGVELAPQLMFAVQQIYELLSRTWGNRDTLCTMLRYCQKSCEIREVDDYTDYRCRVNPWERSNDPDPDLCPLAAVWKSWGLQGKELYESDGS